MLLSTSTNLIAFRPDWVSYIPILESMKRLKAIGFDALDLNLSDAGKSFYRLADDDWRAWMEEVVNLSKALDMPITQSHTPFYNALQPENEKAAVWEPMIHRSIEASGMANVKWIVMHPGTYPDDAIDTRQSKRRNYEYFMPYLELAARHGCGIALENLVDGDHNHGHLRPGKTYCASWVELCELVDSFHMPNVGICWDFGHANLMGIDQREALRCMGTRLKATHIADNSGKRDDHILPFMGTVDWRSILPVLGEIGYEGDLTFEIHNVTSRLPDHLVDTMASTCHDVGRYLMTLAQNNM